MTGKLGVKMSPRMWDVVMADVGMLKIMAHVLSKSPRVRYVGHSRRTCWTVSGVGQKGQFGESTGGE